MSYARTVNFSVGAGEELLDNVSIKNKLMEMLKCDNELEYEKIKQQGILLNFDIFVKDTRIQINNESYNDLIENVVYGTEGTARIFSIKLENACSGTIAFLPRGEQ